ncbi:E3 ubiquitin-protein ligase TRIM21-like [Pseudoliparis swirei]|uniref:E3 ubiquitin-protein ligase TRIM21-like n=1 Tax=Pseudoliparis swirei TaxID=2059687 RepID=UPI0024BD79E6|nr:E3 ubiquitin-protein ligase TRIM21-like [Pseudoliparis swirei]
MTAPDFWHTLENLSEKQFKDFKWFLKQEDVAEGFSAIPEARLEKADRQDTVDLMVQQHGCPGALQITLSILEKISRNDLKQCLFKTVSSRRKDPKNHNHGPLNCDYGRMKSKLGATKTEIKLMIEKRQKKISEINRAEEISSKSADTHIVFSEQVFTVLQRSFKRLLANLIEAIEEKRQTAKTQAEGLVRELQLEISELTTRGAEVEQLSRDVERPDFLQSCSALNALPPTKDWTGVGVSPPSYGGSVATTVKQLEETLREEKEALVSKAKLERVRQFAKAVTLDPDTANDNLVLSKDGKEVYCGDATRNPPDTPERFNPGRNVLGKQSFSSGRFYYEVRVKGKTSWDVGVVKEAIHRKGAISASPENGFWTICLRKGDKHKAHNVHLSLKHRLEKVAVFVDYEKASVAFYDVDSAELIHSYADCSFTGKLLPFFSPGLHYDGQNIAPLVISPVNHNEYIP